MTKEEFEERTGASVTSDEYVGIEQMYLNSMNMEKDEFCSNWKSKDGRRKIMNALMTQIYTLSQYLDNSRCECANLLEERDEIADFLLDNPDADAMRAKAIRLLGSEREYIRRKCESSLPLDDEDKAAILRLL
nr:MAG TPA: hypothetical protein [Caudoviricetes sp.]